MAPTPNDGGDHATAAELYRAIEGVKELMGAHFATVNAKLEPLNRVAADVDQLKARVTSLERADEAQNAIILRLETTDGAEVTYRRLHRPTLLIAAVAALVSLAGVLATVL